MEYSWLITDIIQEALERRTVTCIRLVLKEKMLADYLTKTGAPGEKLLCVLQTGQYCLPPGCEEQLVWDGEDGRGVMAD